MQKNAYLCTIIHEMKQIMIKKCLFALVLAFSMNAFAQVQKQAYLDYINRWKGTAIQQQADYGIPASITMAQALLESAAGKSELAVNAKNHFGIKCTSEWFGGVYYYDDDSKGECFRQYYDAAESFKDHSEFLKRPRYSSCFEIAIEDYEGWAYRLRQCGYATDPLYASKLIKLIEDFRLDTLAVGVKPIVPAAVVAGGAAEGAAEVAEEAEAPKPAKRPLKASVVRKSEPIMVINNDPEPPYVEPLTAKQEKDSFLLMHPKKKCNGVNYVTAKEGDTYSNVAFRLNVRERDLREYNDALGREMQKGDRIYLSAKKATGSEPFVWSHTGQSVWQLSQENGVQLESIQKLNGLDVNIRTFRTRQKIYLKKVKEEVVYH